VLLHRDDVAKNRSARYTEEPYDIQPEDRGLSARLVDDISRVRTDLDALEPVVFDLLVAQAYFLTDATVKIAMPGVAGESAGVTDPRGETARPRWRSAHTTIFTANGNSADTEVLLRAASQRTLPAGRCNGRREALAIWIGLLAPPATIAFLLLALWAV
jgi:hypothetical protein